MEYLTGMMKSFKIDSGRGGLGGPHKHILRPTTLDASEFLGFILYSFTEHLEL